MSPSVSSMAICSYQVWLHNEEIIRSAENFYPFWKTVFLQRVDRARSWHRQEWSVQAKPRARVSYSVDCQFSYVVRSQNKSLQLCLGCKRRQCFAYSTGVSTGTTNSYIDSVQFSSVQFSCSVVCDSLRPHGLQHAWLPCPSPTHGATQTHVHWVGDAI